MSLKDTVWDQIRTADNLQLKAVAADDKSVRFQCSFDLVLDRAAYGILAEKAAKQRHTVANALRRLVKFGFHICFSDEGGTVTDPVSPLGDALS